tara:strand:- start:36 stop:335 length:300 start_codon:yes stop_codon:yes gene_type:complete
MRITARVSKVMDLQKGESANGEWKRQSVLVTQTSNAFKDDLVIDFWNDKIQELKEGRNYDFEIVIKSREYNGKYYTNVNCISVLKSMPETEDEPTDNPF